MQTEQIFHIDANGGTASNVEVMQVLTQSTHSKTVPQCAHAKETDSGFMSATFAHKCLYNTCNILDMKLGGCFVSTTSMGRMSQVSRCG